VDIIAFTVSHSISLTLQRYKAKAAEPNRPIWQKYCRFETPSNPGALPWYQGFCTGLALPDFGTLLSQ